MTFSKSLHYQKKKRQTNNREIQWAHMKKSERKRKKQKKEKKKKKRKKKKVKND